MDCDLITERNIQLFIQLAPDFEWARTQGVNIERFNLAQQPLLFAQNEIVKGFLARSGKEAL
ncbi:arsenic metallochaperone ArsD family protein, partial [Salmonella enterica subsp. enterica serovar Kentucky]|nr:arsenic metallochaperone ArsD family protein [Salmonella enterica subsp. enterica serovar Kentucky]